MLIPHVVAMFVQSPAAMGKRDKDVWNQLRTMSANCGVVDRVRTLR